LKRKREEIMHKGRGEGREKKKKNKKSLQMHQSCIAIMCCHKRTLVKMIPMAQLRPLSELRENYMHLPKTTFLTY
jgi:hypothetical protein